MRGGVLINKVQLRSALKTNDEHWLLMAHTTPHLSTFASNVVRMMLLATKNMSELGSLRNIEPAWKLLIVLIEENEVVVKVVVLMVGFKVVVVLMPTSLFISKLLLFEFA